MSKFKFGDKVRLNYMMWNSTHKPEDYGLSLTTIYVVEFNNITPCSNELKLKGSSVIFNADWFELVEDCEVDYILYKGWKVPKRYGDENATEIEKSMFETFKKSADKHAGPHAEKESDAVHSPKHYAVFDDIEAIEVIARSMTQEMFKGYCFGNLLKYRLRVGGKDEVMQELGKADKYKELYEKFKGLCQ